MPIVAPPAGNDVVFLKLKLKSINLMYTLHLWVDVSCSRGERIYIVKVVVVCLLLQCVIYVHIFHQVV